MVQKQFAERVIKIIANDQSVIGLAAGGSWITGEMDEYSDVDLILVTAEKITGDKAKMVDFADRFGELLTGFTGEHVGEPRLLICLYDNPLLHVDIKFVTLEEFGIRVETPVILFDRDLQLQRVIEKSAAEFPYPDYQWIEDRFWVWIHYALLKIGRGEYVEAFDFFGSLRMIVLGPLLHIKNGSLPRGVRKVETQLTNKDDLGQLKMTLPVYEKAALFESLEAAVSLYRRLRKELFGADVNLQAKTEEKVMQYFDGMKNANNVSQQ